MAKDHQRALELRSKPLLPRLFPAAPAKDPRERVASERKHSTRVTFHLMPVLHRPLELWDRASDTLLGLHTGPYLAN